MIDQDKLDQIHNALIIGMSLEDAYCYAGLSPDEIVELSEDTVQQQLFAQKIRTLEYTLLDNMRIGALRQLAMGDTRATQWLLEHIYPRYTKNASVDQVPINISFKND